jgi:hypothetical protein
VSVTDLERIVDHLGFVNLSRWPECPKPCAVGLRLGDGNEVTWIFGHTIDEALEQAVWTIELVGPPPKVRYER